MVSGLTLESRESAALRDSAAHARLEVCTVHYRRPPNGHGGLERDTSPSERCASMFDTLVISFDLPWGVNMGWVPG